MQKDMEGRAVEMSGLLCMIIDKPMVVGNDEGTSREFEFLGERVKGIDIFMSSFNGSITYAKRYQARCAKTSRNCSRRT